MSDVVFRKGEHVLLRPLQRADLPAIRRWMNDPETTQYRLARAFPLMEKAQEEWLDRLSGSTTEFGLGIVTIEDNKLIGWIGLHEVDWAHRTATTSTTIGEADHLGKGYGTEAKMLLLDFAFNALDLYAVRSRVMDDNKRSLAYARKNGYEEVGRLPKWIRRQDGERCDEVVLVVTQEQWRPLWQEYLRNRRSPG